MLHDENVSSRTSLSVKRLYAKRYVLEYLLDISPRDIFMFSKQKHQKGYCFGPLVDDIQSNLMAVKKVKLSPVLPLIEHHAMKAYWGSGGTVPPFL